MESMQLLEGNSQINEIFSVNEVPRIYRPAHFQVSPGEKSNKYRDIGEPKQMSMEGGVSYPGVSTEKKSLGRAFDINKRPSFELHGIRMDSGWNSRLSFDDKDDDGNLRPFCTVKHNVRQEEEWVADTSATTRSFHQGYNDRSSIIRLEGDGPFLQRIQRDDFVDNQLANEASRSMVRTIPQVQRETISRINPQPSILALSSVGDVDPLISARMKRRMEERYRSTDGVQSKADWQKCISGLVDLVKHFFSFFCALCKWRRSEKRRRVGVTITDLSGNSSVSNRLMLLSHQFVDPSTDHQADPLPKEKFGEESWDSEEDSIFEDSILFSKARKFSVRSTNTQDDLNSNSSLTNLSNPTVCSSFILREQLNSGHNFNSVSRLQSPSHKPFRPKYKVKSSNQGSTFESKSMVSSFKGNISQSDYSKEKFPSLGDTGSISLRRLRSAEKYNSLIKIWEPQISPNKIFSDVQLQNSLTCCSPQTSSGSLTDQFKSEVLNFPNSRRLEEFADIDIEASQSSGSVVAVKVINLHKGVVDELDEKIFKNNLSPSVKKFPPPQEHELSKIEQLRLQSSDSQKLRNGLERHMEILNLSENNAHQDVDHLSVNLSPKTKRKWSKISSRRESSCSHHSRSVNELLDKVSITMCHQQRKKDFFHQKYSLCKKSISTFHTGCRESAMSVYGVMSAQKEIDKDFVENCHALVLNRKLYEPPISVDEFLETRVDPQDDSATRIIKAWAYLSCFPPMHTSTSRTRPQELNLHPGVIVRLLGTSANRDQDPLCIYSAWDICSKGLLHFYRSRYSWSNCHYHLYRVWKEILEMGPELSNKLRNLLALGNHPDYNIYDPEVSEHGEFFRLALNVFGKNILVGADIGRRAVHLADKGFLAGLKVSSLKETNTHKSFMSIINRHMRADPSCSIEGYQLYDQAKLLAPCIFNYFGGYVSKFGEGKIIYKTCRIHSRAHYYLLSDNLFDCEGSDERVSYLSAPYLILNWLSAVFYFEDPFIIRDFLRYLQEDPIVEVVSIKNEMKSKSLIRVTVIVNKLEYIGKPPEAELSSFFLELRLQYLYMWYFRKQTFRLHQIAICEPEHLLRSLPIFDNLVRK